MIYDETAQRHLSGQTFSTDYALRISRREADVPDRLTLLERLARGKRVIHLGCADHLPVIDEKRAAGQWLQDRLASTASYCLGIDIDAEAISYLRTRHGLKDVIQGDILTDDIARRLRSETWDVMILGEIVEHMDNPVAWLGSIRELYRGCVKSIVVTVPNSTSLRNFINAVRHLEVNNSDHRYTFSPFTLGKVLSRAGFKATEFQFCESGFFNITLRNKAKRLLLKHVPAWRDTLVAQADFI